MEPLLGFGAQTLAQAVPQSCLAEATDAAGTPQCNSSPLSWAVRRLLLQPRFQK